MWFAVSTEFREEEEGFTVLNLALDGHLWTLSGITSEALLSFSYKTRIIIFQSATVS